MPGTARPPHVLACALLLLGSLGAAAVWTLASLWGDRLFAWMAVVAALDVALLLRYARMPAGRGRALLALAGTALAVVLANWWIAGSQIGAMVGLAPWDSLARMGGGYAWTLVRLANDAAALAWYAVAAVVAVLAAR